MSVRRVRRARGLILTFDPRAAVEVEDGWESDPSRRHHATTPHSLEVRRGRPIEVRLRQGQ
jgi:hypothetical protein